MGKYPIEEIQCTLQCSALFKDSLPLCINVMNGTEGRFLQMVFFDVYIE